MKPKLMKVCNYYLLGKSVREALLAVGYSDSYASHNSGKFLNNREVQRYIRERQVAEATAALADAVCVKENLLKIIKDPQTTAREKSEAIRILDNHNEWNKELEVKMKSLEVAKDISQTPQQLEVNYNVVKKDD